MRLALILALICGPLAYAGYRERTPSLQRPQAAFQAINSEYFSGQLPKPIFRYADLPDSLAETSQQGDGHFLIELRPGVDLTVLRHEACHVATIAEAEEHGPKFDECMTRYAVPQ